MNDPQRYFHGKKDRLRSRKVIDLLFLKGKQFSVFPMKVFWTETDAERLQAAFGVSSRHFKKATDRNLIRRRMRESYRLQAGPLKEKLAALDKKFAMFILFTGKEIPEYGIISEKMNRIIIRMTELASEKTE